LKFEINRNINVKISPYVTENTITVTKTIRLNVPLH